MSIFEDEDKEVIVNTFPNGILEAPVKVRKKIKEIADGEEIDSKINL